MATRQPKRNGIDLDERDILQAEFNAKTATLLAQVKTDVDDLKRLVRGALIWLTGFLLTIIGVLVGIVFKIK